MKKSEINKIKKNVKRVVKHMRKEFSIKKCNKVKRTFTFSDIFDNVENGKNPYSKKNELPSIVKECNSEILSKINNFETKMSDEFISNNEFMDIKMELNVLIGTIHNIITSHVKKVDPESREYFYTVEMLGIFYKACTHNNFTETLEGKLYGKAKLIWAIVKHVFILVVVITVCALIGTLLAWLINTFLV